MTTTSARTRRAPSHRTSVATLLAVLGLVLVTACGAPAAAPPAPAAADATRTIVDQAGNTVTIPQDVRRVSASIGAFAQIVAMLGRQDQLVASIKGLSDTFRTVWPNANPEGHDSANIEDVIAAGAQVAIGPNFTDEQRTQLTAAGVVPIKIDAFSDVAQMKSVVTLIGDILGDEAPAKAAAFNTYYDQNIAYVQSRTSSLAPADRVKVLNLRYSANTYTTVAATDISAAYVAAAGGDFASKDVGGQGIGTNIDAEQVNAWAPEVIFTMGRQAHDRIVSDPALAHVPAVVAGKVYTEPSGTYPWSVRSAEGALMPLFLAKILYPDLFADLSLEDRTRDFYQRFYGYSLSDQQVATILAGSE